MLIESKSIKSVLANAIQDYLEKSNRTTHESTRAVFHGVYNVLAHLLNEIDKAEKNNLNQEEFMKTIESELVKQVINISEIEIRHRTSEIEDNLKEVIDGLKPGEAALLTDKIKYGHLQTKISQMKHDKKIPDNIFVSKRRENVYLLKK